MKRYFLVLGAIAVCVAGAAAAGDAWKDKPYQSWDQKDVLKILNDSPWSQSVMVQGDNPLSNLDANAEQGLAGTPKSYQIVIVSSDLTDFVNAGEEQLRKTAYLETKKSKQRIAPANAQFMKTEDGRSVAQILFEFAKQNEKGEATLAPDEKGVDFFASAGKLKLKFHFDLSKMADKDGIDL